MSIALVTKITLEELHPLVDTRDVTLQVVVFGKPFGTVWARLITASNSVCSLVNLLDMHCEMPVSAISFITDRAGMNACLVNA